MQTQTLARCENENVDDTPDEANAVIFDRRKFRGRGSFGSGFKKPAFVVVLLPLLPKRRLLCAPRLIAVLKAPHAAISCRCGFSASCIGPRGGIGGLISLIVSVRRSGFAR